MSKRATPKKRKPRAKKVFRSFGEIVITYFPNRYAKDAEDCSCSTNDITIIA